jgi:hypothetical protein
VQGALPGHEEDGKIFFLARAVDRFRRSPSFRLLRRRNGSEARAAFGKFE